MHSAVLRAGYDPTVYAPRAEFSDASVYAQSDKENAQPAARHAPPTVGPSEQYTEPSTSRQAGKQNQNINKRNAPPAKNTGENKPGSSKPATHPAKKSRDEFPPLPAATQPPVSAPPCSPATVAPWAPAPPTDFEAIFARMSTMMAQQIEQAFAAREMPPPAAASAVVALEPPVSSRILAAAISNVEAGIKDSMVISDGLMSKDAFIGSMMSKDLPELSAQDVFESMDEGDEEIDAEAEASSKPSAYDEQIFNDLP
jgi:hypothetical protein